MLVESSSESMRGELLVNDDKGEEVGSEIGSESELLRDPIWRIIVG